MCGIAGVIDVERKVIPNLQKRLETMNLRQAHRGPDGEGFWLSKNEHIGLAHRRLSIIDIESGQQPMSHEAGIILVFNGEIYNYIEIREQLGIENFKTSSDTEVIIMAYLKWGRGCISRFRGMFSFALWDERNQSLFIARDRVGIKPLYYIQVGSQLYFASEVKALLPFLPEIKTDFIALREYLTFQLYLGGKTLFDGVKELPPATILEISPNGTIKQQKYWEVFYQIDYDHSASYFDERLAEIFDESVVQHCRSDVPVGAYLSGGVDSSLIALSASSVGKDPIACFTGKFSFSPAYDETPYARAMAKHMGVSLEERDIVAKDFIDNIYKVMYHLDYPVAGPGSFSQYMISETAAKTHKVVLGGQGGDEIFGGYVRYLIAYFEQCIKGAIDGTLNSGSFLVTYESMIPNLSALRSYKPLLKDFWSEGLFDPMDERYFRLINRAPSLKNEINWDIFNDYSPFEAFKEIFHARNVNIKAYFEKMTHFDFKTLLPALLQIEDRVSMAHGLESRVPFLDHEIIEFAATVPVNFKFKGGKLKHLLMSSLGERLPSIIKERQDKMGFPTPINIWAKGEAKTFIMDIFHSKNARTRPYLNKNESLDGLLDDSEFGRKLWGLLSLEIWNQVFIDPAASLAFKE